MSDGSKGYTCVGLYNPKDKLNVGSVARACGNFNARFLAIQGLRYKRIRTDTMKIYKHIPIFQMDNLKYAIPYNCAPVAVDLVDDATNIIDFVHPPRAFYIFGPEDGTLHGDILNFCKDKIYIPTNRCMNLAATVHVVLYDRMMKRFSNINK